MLKNCFVYLPKLKDVKKTDNSLKTAIVDPISTSKAQAIIITKAVMKRGRGRPKQTTKTVPVASSSKKSFNTNVRKCLICRSLRENSSNQNQEEQDGFQVYKKLVSVLDANYRLPDADFIDQDLHHCCPVCSRAVKCLWTVQQQMQAIKSDMNEIVGQIKDGMRSRRKVVLERKYYDKYKIKRSGQFKKSETSNTRNSSKIDTIEEQDNSMENEPSVQIKEEAFEMTEEEENEFAFPLKIFPDSLSNSDFESTQDFTNDSSDLQNSSEAITRTRTSRSSKAKANELIQNTISGLEDEESQEGAPSVDLNDNEDDGDASDYSPDPDPGDPSDNEDQENSVIEVNEDSTDVLNEFGNELLPIGSESEIIAESSTTAATSTNLTGTPIINPKMHKEGYHFCNICNTAFRHKQHLERHTLYVHKNPTKFELNCPQPGCPKTFWTLHHLSRHLSVHNKLITKNKSTKPRQKPQKPLVLPVIRKIPPTLAPGIRCVCNICGKAFNRPNYLAFHMQRIHVGLRPFKCSSCPLSFFDKKDRTRHQRIHSGERPFDCTRCKKTFTRRDCMLEHRRRVCGFEDEEMTNDDPGTSGAPLKVKSKNAKRTEKPEKVFTCEFCSFSSKQRIEYENHRNASHGEIPTFNCTFCEKKFYSKSNLNRHTVIHEGEKKNTNGITMSVTDFKCNICEIYFKSRKSLLFHDKRLHRDELLGHKCSVCPRRFHARRDLERHLRTHTKEKPYACDVCGTRFGRSDYLLAHQRRVCLKDGRINSDGASKNAKNAKSVSKNQNKEINTGGGGENSANTLYTPQLPEGNVVQNSGQGQSVSAVHQMHGESFQPQVHPYHQLSSAVQDYSLGHSSGFLSL